MKKTGKILSILLAFAFVLTALLTGCGATAGTGGDTSGTVATAAATQAETTAPKVSQDPYEVKWYMVGTKDYPDGKVQVQDEIAKRLADMNTTLKLQVFPWGEYPNKMSMIIASGDPFDISFMGAWTGYGTNVAKGAFADITDLIKTDLPKLSAVLDPAFLEAPKIKGKIYGIPTNKETFTAFGLEFDPEYAKQAGVSFDNVKTYADLEPVLKAAKEKLPADVFPMTFQSTSYFKDGTFDDLGDYLIPGVVRMGDDKVIDQFETPEFMANWQLAYKWAQEGLTNKNGATKGAPDYWNQRKGLCRVETMGPLKTYIGSKGQIIERHIIGQSVITTGADTGAMMCFSKNAPNLKRAMQFFDTVSTDSDLYNLLAFGIKDRDYTVLDANTNPIKVAMPGDLTEDTVPYVHAGGAWSLGGDWFLSFLGRDDPADRNEQVKALNQSAVASKLLGFAFDAEPVKTEVAACGTVYQEIGIALNCGAVDPATSAPKFIQKLKDAGMQKILDEKQRQIDQWKADNGK